MRSADGQCSVKESLRFPPQNSEDAQCLDSWKRGEFKAYPDDFGDLRNEAEIYRCPSRGVRVIMSNGIPNHDVTLYNAQGLCEIKWVIELPLDPVVAEIRIEIPTVGMVAMATNGIPAYGPMEAFNANAVEPTDSAVFGAGFWYGHASLGGSWHFHNPQMGEETVTSKTLLGYAMDGFPIYGPLSDNRLDRLDACNGLTNRHGSYEYHVRTLDQVDEFADYCNGDSPETNWNYILGCYSGSVEHTEIFSADDYELDADCVLQGQNKRNSQNRRYLR
eukprot:CAMPEP_0170812694 /NCGR_PEP_ID=MMETSP0733-20121128/36223_1 /TAXON_ID=186038 /ORGANISM="Fragilariopsis kerguelensis, Strain L26-C5" /LENGTH=275 /DNA_ID=CAMNT_0011169525 /DNA_START=35 /DNA_END=862 /DNA_ORIENTATION=-